MKNTLAFSHSNSDGECGDNIVFDHRIAVTRCRLPAVDRLEPNS